MPRPRHMVFCCLAAIVILATQAWGEKPEICRIQGGDTKLIFGTGFEPGHVAVHAWSPTVEMEDLQSALARAVTAGVDPPGPEALPARPPAEARKLRILEVDPRGLTLAAEFYEHYDANGYYDATAGEEVCWVENGDGFSPPQLVRSAQPWWVFPERARPGDRIRVFGRNLSGWGSRETLVALVSEDGEVLTVANIGKVRHPVYERSFTLPVYLPAGTYKVYLHNQAGGVAGWSEPLVLAVATEGGVEPHVIEARDVGVKGNGIDDDTAALQQALREESKQYGGVVVLHAGRFPITSTLEVPEGVSLRGMGEGNSIIEVIDERPMPPGFPDGAELEGYPRDWLPHMRQQNAPPLVWLRSRSRLSDLTPRSGPDAGTGVLVARCPGVAEEVVIERCVIRMAHEAPGWLPEVPIRVAGDTYGFKVSGCRLEG